MDNHPKRRSLFVLRLIVGLALLGCARMGSAQGTWSVISLPQKPGEVDSPQALAVDTAGTLYVAERPYAGHGNNRIQKRDAQGNWSVIASYGTGLGQVALASALAVDVPGNLYVADWAYSNGWRIQKRDAQGNWSVITTEGSALVQPDVARALAVDLAGNLYIADYGRSQILKRDAQGNWSVTATAGTALGQVGYPVALAADAAGNLYVAEGSPTRRIQKRDAQGNWSVIATNGPGVGQVELANNNAGLAVDTAGSLYVADDYSTSARIQKRDAQGNWSVIATGGTGPGQVGENVVAIAVDATGSVYVAERPGTTSVDNQIQKRDAQGDWSVIATAGDGLGQVYNPSSLAVDGAGNLYVADNGRIQKRDAQGNWSAIASLSQPSALAADTAGNLYAAYDYDSGGCGAPIVRSHRIQKRDAQGNWSQIDDGKAVTAMAADRVGNLYVAGGSQIQKRDAQGNWSVIATAGDGLGQVDRPSGLAVDSAGSLYVADSGNNRVQKYTPGP